MLKKTLVFSLFTGTLLLLVQCAGQEKNTPQEVKSSAKDEINNSVVGGWKTIAVSEKIEVLADYVFNEKNLKSSIKEISNAASQVVSGKNYRFHLLLENGEIWEVQIYVDLQQTKRITEFKQIAN